VKSALASKSTVVPVGPDGLGDDEDEHPTGIEEARATVRPRPAVHRRRDGLREGDMVGTVADRPDHAARPPVSIG
jgi:hypothetical protein